MHDYELDLGRDSDDESLESFFEVGHKRVPTVSATVRVPVHGRHPNGHAGHPVPVHRPGPPRPGSRISGGGRWTRDGSNIIVHGVYAGSGGGADREFGGAAWETEYESETAFMDYFQKCMSAAGLPAPDTIFGAFKDIKKVYRVVKTLLEIAEANPEMTIAEAVEADLLGTVFLVVGEFAVVYYATSCARCLAIALGKNWSGGLTLGNAWRALTT